MNANKKCTICADKDKDALFFVQGKNDCFESCAKADGNPYLVTGHECVRKCPAGYFRERGSFDCVAAGSQTVLSHAVRLDVEYRYFTRRAVSYAQLDLALSDARAAAFLEVPATLAALTLRATVVATYTEPVKYAPAIFLRGPVLLSCEFFYSAAAPAKSAVLAVRLLGPLQVVGCVVSSSFATSGPYKTVLFAGGTVSGKRNRVDLDGENADAWVREGLVGSLV